MDSPYIECSAVSRQYKGKRETINAVSNVSILISKGELVLLKGRSGAGKSTLLNLIGGLISPSSGKIMVDEMNLNNIDNKTLSRLLLDKIGIIFQDLNLLPTYTVYENVEIALVPKGMHRNEIRDLVLPLFGQFGLEDKIDTFPEELSAGQQQKVAIIRTLAKQPAIILADEPTASVDEETGKEILESLRKMRDERGVTVIIATHGTAADFIADRIIYIENGYIKK